jgi:Tfp pilus assembly protein PilZ
MRQRGFDLPRLKLQLADKTEFARFQDSSQGAGGLFVPGSDTPSVGEAVTVEVVFKGGPRVLLRGVVTWRRATGDARARPGVGIAVDPGEKPKLEFIYGYVRGGLIDVRERRRLPVRLRVAYSSPRGRRVNFTRDIDEEGAFVRAAELLEIGSRTQLLISPPGGDFKPIEVHALVHRQEVQGSDRGMGVRFDFADDQERERVQAFVGKLEQDYLAGHLPDEALI